MKRSWKMDEEEGVKENEEEEDIAYDSVIV